MARTLAPLTWKIAAFFIFLATLFFWLSAFSTPYIKSIYYLHTRRDGVRYGTFGWCAPGVGICLHHRVGYYWIPEIPGGKHLTGSLFLVAWTAGWGTLAFLALMHSIVDLRSGFLSFILSLWTCFWAFISSILVWACWGIAHHRFNNNSLDAHYGSAFVLVTLGWLLYMAAIPLVIIGWFRERKYRRERLTTQTGQGTYLAQPVAYPPGTLETGQAYPGTSATYPPRQTGATIEPFEPKRPFWRRGLNRGPGGREV